MHVHQQNTYLESENQDRIIWKKTVTVRGDSRNSFMVGGTTSFFQQQHNFTWQQYLDDEEDEFLLTAFVRLSAPVSGSKLWLLFHQKRAMDIPVHQHPCTDSQLRKEQEKIGNNRRDRLLVPLRERERERHTHTHTMADGQVWR
jgi:hypothetical protein